MVDRIWIELQRPRDDEEGNRRAKLLCAMLKKLGVPYQQPVFWHPKAERYCFTIDMAGGFVEAGDNGHWFDLHTLAANPEAISPEHRFDGVDREEWEFTVFRNADYFTVITGRSPFDRTRKEFKDFAKAVTEAKNGPRATMVYAVTANGRSVMIPQNLWDNYLAMWGEWTKSTSAPDNHTGV